MSLVFAAITPHPPLLIPTIGKEAIKKLEKTKKAMEKMEEDLYLARPDIIMVISPHGSYFKEAFTINICPEFETDFRDFGDLTTKTKFKGEMNLSVLIREEARDEDFPLTMISEKGLDHGSGIPLYYLTRHLPNAAVLPIGFCDLDWKTHLNFGYLIKEQIMRSQKRVAVIASGDLSHALSNDAPAGYNQAGEEFDKKIQELLSSRNTVGMLQLDKNFVNDASECGFRSFLMLMGILRGVNFDYKKYSYESPFGVGYLTANFTF
ncbi:MAG: class III extradiol dioxygenase subunit B-like domain-containing protein [Patescibacteria group bacterium]|nr:class III extradiol dioxygenase subunit B-like domain-containing protein [Patescibacteria group bacterium]